MTVTELENCLTGDYKIKANGLAGDFSLLFANHPATKYSAAFVTAGGAIYGDSLTNIKLSGNATLSSVGGVVGNISFIRRVHGDTSYEQTYTAAIISSGGDIGTFQIVGIFTEQKSGLDAKFCYPWSTTPYSN